MKEMSFKSGVKGILRIKYQGFGGRPASPLNPPYSNKSSKQTKHSKDVSEDGVVTLNRRRGDLGRKEQMQMISNFSRSNRPKSVETVATPKMI